MTSLVSAMPLSSMTSRETIGAVGASPPYFVAAPARLDTRIDDCDRRHHEAAERLADPEVVHACRLHPPLVVGELTSGDEAPVARDRQDALLLGEGHKLRAGQLRRDAVDGGKLLLQAPGLAGMLRDDAFDEARDVRRALAGLRLHDDAKLPAGMRLRVGEQRVGDERARRGAVAVRGGCGNRSGENADHGEESGGAAPGFAPERARASLALGLLTPESAASQVALRTADWPHAVDSFLRAGARTAVEVRWHLHRTSGPSCSSLERGNGPRFTPSRERRIGRVRLKLEIALATTAGRLSRLAGRGGGTTLPGKILATLDPRALRTLAQRLPRGSALVSATNGKTTTAAIVAEILGGRVRLAHNRAGANLVSGVASALLAARDAELGLFEVDEGAFADVAGRIRPHAVCLGNLFRDQLDRYGELELVADRWRAAVRALDPAARLVVNGDDPQVGDLARERERSIVFGPDDPRRARPALQHAADSKYCL